MINPFKTALVGFYHEPTEEWPERFYSLSETNGGPGLTPMFIKVFDEEAIGGGNAIAPWDRESYASYEKWLDDNGIDEMGG